MLLVLLALVAAAHAAPAWRLVHHEDFSGELRSGDHPWRAESDRKPVDHMDDDGRFFHVMGGEAFARERASFKTWRKRFKLGRRGWLTAELAARSPADAEEPENEPSLYAHEGALHLRVPDAYGGLLVRSTKPLPPRYRVEYRLLSVDFGGSRAGREERPLEDNGYPSGGEQTSRPWAWGPPPAQWPDVRSANGFYFLGITDYPDPSPRNNVFIHTHRKVVIDSYNVRGPGSWEVCDPRAKKHAISDDNVLHMLFLTPGSHLESRAIMETECGTAYGGEGGRTPFVGADWMEFPKGRSYVFAIERDADGFTLEASGPFRSGERTFRYKRKFVQDGRAIWHYNQSPEEYDGAFDSRWAFSGPHGEIEIPHSWPKGSAYPEHFIIGDPHLNFYAGRAALTDLKLYVPAE